MLQEGGRGFVPLPKEKVIYTSPARTTISIHTPNTYPGKEPLDISSNSGIAYITNQRLVYLPSTPSASFQSFSAPILNLMDSHVTAPWFGANAWTAVLKPVTGGGIPAQHAFVEVKLVFKDGGTYDFHRVFEELKDKLSHAAESAREHGRRADLSDVPLEQLPAYEASSSQETTPNIGQTTATATPEATQPAVSNSASLVPAPNEPPPGYEEAQSAGVAASLEESVRRQNT